MSAMIIDGKATSARLMEKLTQCVSADKAKLNKAPKLCVIIVGEDPASSVYVRRKGEQATKIGFGSQTIRFESDIDQKTVLDAIVKANLDPEVNGILVQLPLPAHIDSLTLLQAIDPAKDVDGFTVHNAGALFSGQNEMIPCTPMGSMILLAEAVQSSGKSLEGLHAVVIGRSNIVGKPMAQLLLQADCTVTMAHSRTHDLASVCKSADIVVAAVGRPLMIKGDWIKKGAIVIDVGINRVDLDGKSKLLGDVDFEACLDHVGAITPVPGGVGPMTIACLMINTYASFRKAHNLKPIDLIKD
jgi:methylenetetrahydrofolate dehydrogenase (NADP+)/methenyltetrahydrofolate cyclohydrolase